MTIPELLVSRGWATSPAEVNDVTVSEYQEWHGLKVDGYAGPVTRRSLEAPRVCGLPDQISTEEANARGHGKNRFTWWFDDSVSRLRVPPADLLFAFQWAFQAWRAAGVDLVGTQTNGPADLHVFGVNMGGPGGVLADSTLYQLPGRHRYDTNEPFTIKIPPAPSKILLNAVVCHEIGHFLGCSHLDHRRFPNSLMNPIYNPNIISPQEHDVRAMLDLGYPALESQPDDPGPADPTPGPTGLTKQDVRDAVDASLKEHFSELVLESISRLGRIIE